jgi:hypothetical protein
MARYALADDLANGDLEGGEQGRGAVAFIVMRHGATAALLQRPLAAAILRMLQWVPSGGFS